MDPKEIIDALIDGQNPVTKQPLDNESAWVKTPVIRALYNVLRVVNATPADSTKGIDAQPEKVTRKPPSSSSGFSRPVVSAEPAKAHPDPDIGDLQAMVREGSNTELCCHCHARVPRNHMTLTGEEDVFVFCDDDCFDGALRSLIYFFGWISVFESSLNETFSRCSICDTRIKRDDFVFLNFVLNDHNYSNSKEVAIVCSDCRDKSMERFEESRS